MRQIEAPKNSTDTQIERLCKENVLCQDCHISGVEFPTTEPLTRIYPVDNVVAIVVDIAEGGGKFKIYNLDDKFVGNVGYEAESEHMMIVQWQKG
ncbi:hypothetical protein SODALDRAFT_332726 [Sodiomyces alkalinus F11]|uniref:Uncharacterized protein n=1 Tax=Sodiomyces alkalinus (strain CBS 110278 / VKM F-3762 / F11) TaxID=1314773 RepID=A0A3N2PXN0_SODAK|nr:hypothetical protein SODALDRAFT_332726 [Sodiomyces alkalinus F11]ROT39290.1 hypothetical protein SODALDRAFT_332726 [Sodiomyces alkalinus F11]